MASSWEVRMSRSRGQHYFYNRDTQESLWEPPSGLSSEELTSLPGAAKYLTSPDAPATKVDEKPAQVRASHLLVKHSGSRRPASWKEPKITRSKEEAIALLNEYNAEIDGDPEKFAALAQKNSDCSSHEHGGDLGWFRPGQMQRPFEEATYALSVGQISDVVTTDSGVHLILRTG